MNHKIKGYGWVPDLPDHRDFSYAAPMEVAAALPSKVDLRPQCPPVYDQGQLGSCTANAIGAAHEFEQMKQKKPKVFAPSRLFIYYNERVMERSVNSDAGGQIRDGIKSIADQGVCSETEWPYIVTKFRAKPPARAYKDAKRNQAVSYQRIVQSPGQFKGCLASGYPFAFGFTVYESFESPAVAKTGNSPMPASQEKSLGGHAVLAVGYDDTKQHFIVRNSWGPTWGQQGYFTLPYAYLTDPNLASDFWTIRLVE